jgi:hypothetical protein
MRIECHILMTKALLYKCFQAPLAKRHDFFANRICVKFYFDEDRKLGFDENTIMCFNSQYNPILSEKNISSYFQELYCFRMQ